MRDDNHLYSLSNFRPLLGSGVTLCFRIFGPYVIPILVVHIWMTSSLLLRLMDSALLFIIIVDIMSGLVWFPPSPLNKQKGKNYYGSTARLGIHVPSSSNLHKVLQNCPNLNSSNIQYGALSHVPLPDGSVAQLRPTPWIFSGDARTLLPFVLFQPDSYRFCLPLFGLVYLCIFRYLHNMLLQVPTPLDPSTTVSRTIINSRRRIEIYSQVRSSCPRLCNCFEKCPEDIGFR